MQGIQTRDRLISKPGLNPLSADGRGFMHREGANKHFYTLPTLVNKILVYKKKTLQCSLGPSLLLSNWCKRYFWCLKHLFSYVTDFSFICVKASHKTAHIKVEWSGGEMVLGKLPAPGHPTIWMTVGQGPIVLAVGAGGGLFGHFYSRLSFLSSFSLSLGDGPI